MGMQDSQKVEIGKEGKDVGKYCHPNCVSEKEVLELAWNYFQQHAQQRLSFFNFFVAFSALTTTGLISTFQEKYDAHSIGIAIGLMLSLISYVFYKIDERNKYLTKKGEDAIKQIEKHFSCAKCYPDKIAFQIFLGEEEDTGRLRVQQKKKNILLRQISHSKSFNIIFIIFFLVGIIGASASVYFQFYGSDIKRNDIDQKTYGELVIINAQLVRLVNSNDKTNKELLKYIMMDDNAKSAK